jgi:uncharacterized membrane protein SpoIIM required for sporulation
MILEWYCFCIVNICSILSVVGINNNFSSILDRKLEYSIMKDFQSHLVRTKQPFATDERGLGSSRIQQPSLIWYSFIGGLFSSVWLLASIHMDSYCACFAVVITKVTFCSCDCCDMKTVWSRPIFILNFMRC